MNQPLSVCDLVITASQCIAIAPLLLVSAFVGGKIDCVTAYRAARWSYLFALGSAALSALFRPCWLFLALPSVLVCYELTRFLCDASDCGVSFAPVIDGSS